MAIMYSIVLVLIILIIDIHPAKSSTDPDGRGMTNYKDPSNGSYSTRYILVTLPSINRKKVDLNSIKFLSLIPKATLIPKTEEKVVYRLVSDKFEKLQEAKKFRTQVLQYCESPFIIKNNRYYYVIASSQMTEVSALAEQLRLDSKKIRTTILELSLPLKHWQLKSSEDFSIRDAVNMANRLSMKGVISTIEPKNN